MKRDTKGAPPSPAPINGVEAGVLWKKQELSERSKFWSLLLTVNII